MYARLRKVVERVPTTFDGVGNEQHNRMLGTYHGDCQIEDWWLVEQVLKVVYDMAWSFCHRRPGLAQLHRLECRC